MPCLRMHIGCDCSEAIMALLSAAPRTREERDRYSRRGQDASPDKAVLLVEAGHSLLLAACVCRRDP